MNLWQVICIVAAALLLWMAFWGLITHLVAQKNGREGNWFLKGFFLTGFACAKAMSAPKSEKAGKKAGEKTGPAADKGKLQNKYASASQYTDRQTVLLQQGQFQSGQMSAQQEKQFRNGQTGVLQQQGQFQSGQMSARQQNQYQNTMAGTANRAPTPQALAAPQYTTAKAPDPGRIPGGWTCVCGRVNYPYIGTCACGRNRAGKNAAEEAARKAQREKEEANRKLLEQQKIREAQERARQEQERREREAAERRQAVSRMDEQTKLKALRELRGLLDEGIITQQEYDAKRRDYLDF